MPSDWSNGLPTNILRGIVPTTTLWDGTIGYAYQDDGGAFTDLTVAANNAAAGDVGLLPVAALANDAFYFGEGFATSGTFNSLKITISQAGTNTVVWEYYNGAAWVALTVTDATQGFTSPAGSYYVQWTIPADMGHVAVNGQDRYWVRARCTVGAGVQPVASQIWLGKYPTALANTTDGDITTTTGVGTVLGGGAATCGYISYDLGATKTVLFSVQFSMWLSANTGKYYFEYSRDGITYYQTDGDARVNSYDTNENHRYSASELITTRYIRLYFYMSGAASMNVRILEAKAYHLGD